MERLAVAGDPFPFGLTFVPTQALAPVAPGLTHPAGILARAASTMRAAFAFVPADEPWAEEALAALTDAAVAPMLAFSGPLWPIIEARGTMEGLRATLTRPEEIGAELDVALEPLIASVERAAAVGARAIVLAEDLAGSAGPLLAPDFVIAELMPRYRRVVEAARGAGLPAVLHSDGDVRPLIPAIVRAGFAGLHTGGGLDTDGFDRLFWAAREVGLVVLGGLVTADLANPARAEALGSAIGVMARAGGLFVADDGGITTAREVTGLVTALAAARAV